MRSSIADLLIAYFRDIYTEEGTAHLFIQGHVDRKAKCVFEFDFVGEQLADLSGGGGGVHRQVDGASVHQVHRHDHGLLRLGGLSQSSQTNHAD